MKHLARKIFSAALLVSTLGVQAKDSTTVYQGSIYSGGFNSRTTSNGLIAQGDCLRTCEAGANKVNLSVGFEYEQSFKNKDIAKFLSPNNSNSFKIGTDAATTTDVSPLNFFLPSDFASTITYNPKFQTMIVADIRGHLDLGDFMEGMWLNFQVPVVHAKWDLGLKESSVTAGTTPVVTAQAAKNGFDGNATNYSTTFPYTTAVDAFKGAKTVTTVNNVGIVDSVLKYGKIDGARKKTKVGDCRVALGYNFIAKENAQLGLGVLGLFNGDEKSKVEYVNTPVIGQGGRQGVGGRLDGFVRLWENNENEIYAHLRADGAYMMDANVRRSFDFTTNGVWSRYLLLKNHTAYNTLATTGAFVNAINVTSLRAKIGHYGVYDVNVMFAWKHLSWEANVGYNLAGMSKEKHKKWIDTITGSKYVFYGFTNAAAQNTPTTDTTHAPTVHIDGSNGTKGTAAAAGTALADAAGLTAAAITTDSLNKDSGLLPSAMSHRVYGNVGYHWDNSEWAPFVAVGGSAELSSNVKAMHQWSVFFVGGLTF